jgi:hypothetical protein
MKFCFKSKLMRGGVIRLILLLALFKLFPLTRFFLFYKCFHTSLLLSSSPQFPHLIVTYHIAETKRHTEMGKEISNKSHCYLVDLDPISALYWDKLAIIADI